MNYHRMLRAAVMVLAGCAPLLWDQPPAQAAADREAYYYRQKSWVPVELSGRVTRIKQVPLEGSGQEHTVVFLEPDNKRRGRRASYGRPVDLGANPEFKQLSKGDHIMVWGNTFRINEKPVVLADAAEIDGRTIEITRDPGFEKGHIWGRPLRDLDVYEFQNIDPDWTQPGGPHSWYFDSYEYVGYPYREKPPAESAPWARGGDRWERTKQRRAERFQREDAQTRADDRYADEDRYREERREQQMDRRQRTGALSKSDQQLKRDVENELMWSPAVDPDKVSVSVRDGVVTLNGQVNNPEQIDSAIENAYDAGARQVISKLTTKG